MNQTHPLFLPSTKMSRLNGKIQVEKLHKLKNASILSEKFKKKNGILPQKNQKQTNKRSKQKTTHTHTFLGNLIKHNSMMTLFVTETQHLNHVLFTELLTYTGALQGRGILLR